MSAVLDFKSAAPAPWRTPLGLGALLIAATLLLLLALQSSLDHT